MNACTLHFAASLHMSSASLRGEGMRHVHRQAWIYLWPVLKCSRLKCDVDQYVAVGCGQKNFEGIGTANRSSRNRSKLPLVDCDLPFGMSPSVTASDV
eukprot:5519943-Pleurochrysis_carterae.AAC.1